MLTALLYDLWTAIRRRRERRRAIADLWALDDRLLKDIGISRSEIRTVVDGAPRPRERAARPAAPARAPCAPACATCG